MMRKIARITHFQTFLPLFLSQALEEEYQKFLASDLGKMYKAIPWQEITKEFKIKQNRRGPLSIFPPEGKIALMFLKSYSQTSDKRLIEQLNANIHYQFFCEIRLQAGQELKRSKIVSQIRCELAKKLDISRLQNILAQYWRHNMRNKSKLFVDATCYESQMRYPTDQKLIWESVFFLYKMLKKRSRALGIKLPRTKYKQWKARYNAYKRKCRKYRKERRALTRGLIHLLGKLDYELNRFDLQYPQEMPLAYQQKRKTIKKVYEQQSEMFNKGVSCKNRIVSLFKPYVRPIVRGKEAKKVEFGAKVNKIQIDGVSFIQHLSFEAFHEGKHFEKSILLAQKLMKEGVTQIGSDAGYASNLNRNFATNSGIATDFVRKGKAGKYEEKRRKIALKLRKERASIMEGSFGNEKEHYGLAKVRARTKATEILWIFFGIHTANALRIGRRMQKARPLKKAA